MSHVIDFQDLANVKVRIADAQFVNITHNLMMRNLLIAQKHANIVNAFIELLLFYDFVGEFQLEGMLWCKAEWKYQLPCTLGNS